MTNTRRSPSYLVRNAYSYCFRLIVPADLQPYICKKELRYSLRTGYLSEAKQKSRLLAGMTQKLFAELRRLLEIKMDEAQIKKIASDYLQRLKKEITLPIPSIFDDSLERAKAEAWRYVEIQDLKFDKEKLSEEIEKADYMTAMEVLPEVFEQQGISLDELKTIDGATYAKLLLALTKAKLEAMEYHESLIRGAELKDDLHSKTNNTLNSNEKLISEVVPAFISENRIKWTDKTKDEVQASLDLLVECIGDIPIQNINRAKMAEYKEILKKLPPNKNKSPKYRGISIPELIQMDVDKTLSVERINKNLQRAGALFDYAIRHGIYEGQNPATQMQLPKDKWATWKRAPFTDAELEKLFRSKQYLDDSFSKSYMFWTPIIAIFHGMRQNEIAGLFLDDIQQAEDGTWYFDLFSRKSNPKEARRVAPIHPFLINELRFPEYVKHLRAEGHDRLFPELPEGRDGYGKNVSSWFNSRYKTKCGIESSDDRMRDFHSFRTTFITRLRHKKVNDRMLKEVVGHSVHIDVTDTYTDPYPLKQLLEEIISKATFHKEIDLTVGFRINLTGTSSLF